MNLEMFSFIGDFIGGLAVVCTLVFLAVELRMSNKLARAQAQREMRSVWQQTLFKMAEYGPEIQEGLVNFKEMNPVKQLECVTVIASMGNQVDTLLKLEKD